MKVIGKNQIEVEQQEMETKTVKLKVIGVGLVFFLGWLTNAASARIHFSISFGTGCIGHRSFFHHGCYPYYGWDGCRRDYGWMDRGWYRWMDRDRYRGYCGVGWMGDYWRRPGYSSGLSVSSGHTRVCISGFYPAVIERRTIVEAAKVITKREIATKISEKNRSNKCDEDTLEFFMRLRQKKNELVERLESGDKEERKEVIDELAGYSFDTRVREALEEVLRTEEDAELRKAAVISLSKLKNRKALAALEKAMVEDADEEVREEACRAIREIKGK